jgi:hypothetical protein
VTELPGARVPFQDALATVTLEPTIVALPFQVFTIELPVGNENCSCQEDTVAEPLLVMT